MPIVPQETNSPLVIDTNTMFSFAISLQRLKPIRGGKPKILQPHGCVDRIELHKCPLLDLPWELPHELAFEDRSVLESRNDFITPSREQLVY